MSNMFNMFNNSARRLSLVSLAATLVLSSALTACAGRSDPNVESGSEAAAGTASERVAVQVENRGFFDVVIYAMRSPSVQGARVATVSGGQSALVRVRSIDLQPGNRLVLRLRAVGTRYTWTTNSLPVSAGTVAKLDILTSSNGDLSRSSLYSQIAADQAASRLASAGTDSAH